MLFHTADESATNSYRSGAKRRFSPAIAIALIGIAIALGVVVAVVSVFNNRIVKGPAHVCGLSIVQHSAAAIAILGSPITQRGATMGHEQWLTGGLLHRPRHMENATFWVGGPKGSATVRAFSERTPNKSSLTVMLLSDAPESSRILYDGPIKCSEWHGR
jgi:hypothetical protein